MSDLLVKVAECKTGLEAFDTLESLFLSNNLIKDENKVIINSQSNSTGDNEGKTMKYSELTRKLSASKQKDEISKALKDIDTDGMTTKQKTVAKEILADHIKMLQSGIYSNIDTSKVFAKYPDLIGYKGMDERQINKYGNYHELMALKNRTENQKIFDQVTAGYDEAWYMEHAYLNMELSDLTSEQQKQVKAHLESKRIELTEAIKKIAPHAKNIEVYFHERMANGVPNYNPDYGIESRGEHDAEVSYTNKDGDTVSVGTYLWGDNNEVDVYSLKQAIIDDGSDDDVK